MCGRINETGVIHVNKEVKIVEEIGTKDGLLNIGYDENPAKGATKSKVEGKGAGTVSRDWGAIDSLQGQICM